MVYKKIHWFVLIFALIALSSCTEGNKNEQKDIFKNAEFLQLLEFIDTRNADSILPFLKNENVQIRAKAALGFGSFDVELIPINALWELNTDTSELVREYTYFSIGQSNNNEICLSLQEKYKTEKGEKASIQLVIAIAKTIDTSQIELAIESLNSDNHLAEFLYTIQGRSIYSKLHSELLVKLSSSKNLNAQLLALMSISRSKKKVEITENELIGILNSTQNQEIRSYTFLCSRHIDTTILEKFLGNYDKTINSEMEKRSILSVANKFKYSSISENNLTGSFKSCRMMAIQYFINNPKQEVSNKVLLLSDQTSGIEKAMLIKAAYFCNPSNNDLGLLIGNLYNSESDSYIKSIHLSGLEANKSNYDFILNATLETKTPILKNNGTAAIINILKASSIKDVHFEKARNSIYALLESQDDAVISLISDFLITSELGNKIAFSLGVDLLINLKNTLQLPRQLEAAIELTKACNYIFKSNLPMPEYVPKTKIAKENIGKITEIKGIEFKTTSGNFTLKFNHFIAPYTIYQLIELSKKGYYNNKLFHRVVPNFVIQTGCPRGDGWGSEGEILRSEFSPNNYELGIAGMASAGRNTESSQWFVMQLASFNLNGRYTIFGNTTMEGLNSIQNITQGDKIIATTLIKH